MAVGPDVSAVQVGAAVAIDPNVSCGACFYCQEALPYLCPRRTSMIGGFAEYLRTPAANLCPVPAHVPLEHACILGDAVATSYHAVTRRAQIQPGRTVALVGVGGAKSCSVDLRSSSHQPFGTTIASAWRRHSRPCPGLGASNGSSQAMQRAASKA